MYWTYLGEVFKRAFAPTVRVTDGLQIAAASALPAIGKFLGIKMPETIGNDALSYIGAATVAFIVIRMLWAPYALWKDQVAETAGLKLELSKPERLVIEKLAKYRAKAIVKLCGLIHNMCTQAFRLDIEVRKLKVVDIYTVAIATATTAGLCMNFKTRLLDYSDICVEHNNEDFEQTKTCLYCEELLISYINQTITIEDLNNLWPQDTELKKLQ